MGMKPGIALIGVIWTAITLSGCESCGACRTNKPWGQTVSSTQTGNSTGLPASAWANQGRTTTTNPLASATPGVSTNQPGRITDPSLSSTATTSSLTSQSPAPMSPMGTSQAAATFPTSPASQTATGGLDQKSEITNTSTMTAPTQQPSWPSATSTGSGMGMTPAVNTPRTRESSYQTFPSGPTVPNQ